MTIKGTETEKNLLKSFAGESQATNRYKLFAKQAKKEGYEQISAIFTETADNEVQHRRLGRGRAEHLACNVELDLSFLTFDHRRLDLGRRLLGRLEAFNEGNVREDVIGCVGQSFK